MNFGGRVIALTLTLGICVTGVIAIFWHQEMRYQLPTPIPKSYKPVAVGDSVLLPAPFAEGRAYFLHFYNPDCPCSRFNAKHLRSLIGEYQDSVSIIIVVQHDNDVAEVKSQFGDGIDVVTDNNELIAQRCGVYSTPQAAIVDSNHRLYYRGNYNRSRYCTTRATNFAELSLIALINNNPPPAFGIEATQSYGCSLDDPSLASIELF